MQHPVRTILATLPLLAVSISGAQAQTSWLLGGNSGTNAANDFLGTKDNVSLNLRVNNVRGWRLEPTAGTPNIIGGFSGNSVLNSAQGAFIGGGGFLNGSNSVGSNYGTVGGGAYNRAGGTSTQTFATIGGGFTNLAQGPRSTIAGGAYNITRGIGTAVGGGERNQAVNGRATVGGGTANIASGVSSTISGGLNNQATDTWSSVGGGNRNRATNQGATVSGGIYNLASGSGSTIGGGSINVATGVRATVPGGTGNRAAGSHSFAAGWRADAAHDGAFVWSDFSLPSGITAQFSSTAKNEFSALATGGVRFITGLNASFAPSTGVQLAPGSGSWSMLSDRNAKSGNAAANVDAVLDALMKVSIEYWSYKTQNGIRHIGPMAQDFKKAFNVGESDTMISSVDADGVAFAAIQALKIQLDALKKENEALKRQNAGFEARLSALESSK